MRAPTNYRPKTDKDWELLSQLRQKFLNKNFSSDSYWDNQRLLELYDSTFAQRIASKWNWVLGELNNLNWEPPQGACLDWGCGSGIAIRSTLAHFQKNITEIFLNDQSKRATNFAKAQLLKQNVNIKISEETIKNPALQLISHVLSELNEDDLIKTCNQINAETIIWIEPGSKLESRRLGQVRKLLIDKGYNVVAPCFHRSNCGLLEPQHKNDWCHFFAKPDNSFYQDPFWKLFADRLKLDLYVLPVSFLVMDKRPVRTHYPNDLVRVIGHFKKGKAHYLLNGCNADGVEEYRFSQRNDRAFFKLFDKGKALTNQRWTTDGKEIIKISNYP